MVMKALVYGLIALAALSCATVQPDTAMMLEESAVRLAHGEPVLALDEAADGATQPPTSD
jgi:hypothetical protein